MYSFISNMLVVGKRNIQVFQKSILMQITLLKLLFEDMKAKHKIIFISTHKLNQDLLEKKFSQLRQKGGTYDHPSRLHTMYRIREMILGKSPSILHTVTTTSDSKNHIAPNVYITSTACFVNENSNCLEKFISASIFEEADVVPDLAEIIVENDCLSRDLNEQEKDGLEYITGYIARKFKEKYPHLQLGDYTCNAKEDHTYSQSQSFVVHVSAGRLYKPSDGFLAATKWSKFFKIYTEMEK
uniref:Transposable element P transposase-like C-terminal domain-containing protein n=1 Tax=Anopheles stephensi TaxID=30069 RepID=A0A182YRF2_ANOST